VIAETNFMKTSDFGQSTSTSAELTEGFGQTSTGLRVRGAANWPVYLKHTGEEVIVK
jgi:hypothetical protein